MKPALAAAIASIEKQYGKGSVRELGSTDKLDVSVISSGSLGIDIITGVGGFPKGRIVEIFGPESSGKTTVTLHLIAKAQAQGGVCAFIDAEHALDAKYAKQLGVDTDKLLISQPNNGEEALEIADALIRSGEVAVVVIDSVAALVPKAELEGEMGMPTMGLQARLLSSAMRKLTAVTQKSQTCLVFVNQIREKLGILFGSPETTSGGRALKFFSSLRIDVRKVSTTTTDNIKTGNKTKVKIVKNKLASPFRETEVEIIFGEGIDNLADILLYGSEKGIIEKTGSWYSYKGTRIGQGTDNAKEWLKSNPKISTEIESELRKIYFGSEK